MQARPRKAKFHSSNPPRPAQSSPLFGESAPLHTPVHWRQDNDGRLGSGAEFNYSNIPVLSSSHGVVQRTCDTCSKETAAASRESREVNQNSLCPKCRSGNAHKQRANTQVKPLSEAIIPGLQQLALSSGWNVNGLNSHTGQSASNDSQLSNSARQQPLSDNSGNWQVQSTFDHAQNINAHVPSKALGESDETNGLIQRPYAGSATIQCNGSGGYEVALNGWSSAACGTKSCVIAHENSHVADWKAKWPTGCAGRAKGYLPNGVTQNDNPRMTLSQYNSFLKKSECKAHTVDLTCAKALPKSKACKKTIDDYISLTEKQRKKWCPSKAVIGAVAGAIAGGVLGAAIGGPVGALIGGVGGALVGGLIGSFF